MLRFPCCIALTPHTKSIKDNGMWCLTQWSASSKKNIVAMSHAIASDGGKANPLENVLVPQGLFAAKALSLVLSTRITSVE